MLVGVGVEPDTRWLSGNRPGGGRRAGGPRGPQSADGVYAAGDAALAYDPALNRHLRTEHWEAAARQGAAAARAMLDLEPARTPLPSFWSDQYGVRIQFVGRAGEADRIAIDGDPGGRDFEALFTTIRSARGRAACRPAEGACGCPPPRAGGARGPDARQRRSRHEVRCEGR